MTGRLVLRHALATHQGLVRSNNEDSAYGGAHLVALADGVGGEVAGEVASRLAIAALRGTDTGSGDPIAALRDAMDDANARIAAAVDADPDLYGMGTTATAILFRGRHGVLGHVGDSRAYRLRGGELSQLSHDDTYVQMLVDNGRISAADARTHPQRSMVTHVLQGTPVEVTITRFRPDPGDRYLLCSDGLPDAVPDEPIAAALRDVTDRAECAAALVDLALSAGGPDNVTVVVADLLPHRRFRRHTTETPTTVGAAAEAP